MINTIDLLKNGAVDYELLEKEIGEEVKNKVMELIQQEMCTNILKAARIDFITSSVVNINLVDNYESIIVEILLISKGDGKYLKYSQLPNLFIDNLHDLMSEVGV